LVEGVPEHDGRGELRVESLPKALFPGGRLWGFAIAVSRQGKVGEGFDLDAKRGRVEIVCQMYGGKEFARSVPISWLFFFFFFFFVIMRDVF